ncbi:MAG: hypothetical protein ACRDQ7_20615 [Haloechinothrix sp.]
MAINLPVTAGVNKQNHLVAPMGVAELQHACRSVDAVGVTIGGHARRTAERHRWFQVWKEEPLAELNSVTTRHHAIVTTSRRWQW